MAEQDKQTDTTAQESSGQRFQIEKIYVKDISFESPGAPAAFRGDWKPQVDFQLANRAERVDDDLYEVVLHLTVTARHGDDTTFLVELQQAGLFTIAGLSDNEAERVLATFCPTIIFPYAREAVSDLVARGGYPQLMLSPVNFDALYQQQKQRQAQDAASDAAERSQ